jgi:hypothetical protein
MERFGMQNHQLSKEEINNKKFQEWNAISSNRMKLKYSMLILGIITLIASVILIFSLISQGLIVFAVIPLILLSFIFISKFFNLTPYNLYENGLKIRKPGNYREPVLKTFSFVSVASSRLMAGFLLFTIGIIDFFIMGYSIGAPTGEMIGTYQGTGTSFFLGGFSFFYPVGLPPLIIGCGLIVYRFISAFWGRISVSENLYFFHEIRHIRPWLTEIRKQDVEGKRFQNNQIGPKVIWIIIFIPIIFLTLQFGISIFNHPLAEKQTLPILMTITGIIDIIALLILILFPQTYVEMATKDKFYEMWLNPLDYNYNVKKDLENIFENKKEPNESSDPTVCLDENDTKNYFRLVLGMVLLVISIISGTFYILFGTAFSIMGGIYGLTLIYNAIFNDFNKKATITMDNDTNNLVFRRIVNFRNKFQNISIKNAENHSIEDFPRKIEAIDLIFAIAIPIVVIINTVWGLKFTDYLTTGSLLDLILTSIICILILTSLFIYFCIPTKHLMLKSDSITIRLLWGVNKKSGKGTSKGMRYLIEKLNFRNYSKENQRVFIIRAIVLFSIYIGAIIIALAMI